MLQLKLTDISKALTEEVVDRAFKVKTLSTDVAEKISVTRAAPAGEGLLSAVYRIHVVGKHHEASFVAKGLISDELLRNTLNCQKYFKREAQFYSTILPTLIAIQKELGAKESIQRNVAECYYVHCDGFNDFLLFEDLALRGCKTISKNPTVSERNATLKTLAHLHAVSLALRFKEPDLFKNITTDLHEMYYTEDNRNWYDEYYQNAIRMNIAALAEYEDPETSIYYKRFMGLVNDNPYTLLTNLVLELGDNPVLCHGDSWSPNFLCSDKMSVAIDFQLVRCASLVTDLSYFVIITNLCENGKDFNDAIDVYYSALKYYLADMNLSVNQIFPRPVLETELKKYGKYGILASLSSFSLLASKRCDTLEAFGVKYKEYDRIPLAKLWHLTPFETEEDKKQIVNAVRVAVDVGLI